MKHEIVEGMTLYEAHIYKADSERIIRNVYSFSHENNIIRIETVDCKVYYIPHNRIQEVVFVPKDT